MKYSYHLLVLFIPLLFFNCTAGSIQVKATCQDAAFYQLIAASKKYPVRVAVGVWDGEKHVQAEAQTPDGRWLPITNRGRWIFDRSDLKNFTLVKEKYMDLPEGHYDLITFALIVLGDRLRKNPQHLNLPEEFSDQILKALELFDDQLVKNSRRTN